MAITGNGGRPIGLAKTGGRQKGTPNRATLIIQEKLEAIGCDPLIELAKMGMDKATPLEIRERCLTNLLPYVYPKRKPIDIDYEPSVINVTTTLDPGNSDGGDQPSSGA